MTDQLALATAYMTLEETFADWGPTYDAMVVELEAEALDELASEQEAESVPEFLPLAPAMEIGGNDGYC